MAKLIDISIPITNGMAVYPGNPGISVGRVLRVEDGAGANVSRIDIGSHSGTHIDAPLHFLPDGADISGLPLETMNGPAKVIEVGAGKIGVSALDRVECGDRVLFKTANSENFDCVRLLEDYVTLSYDAARYLVSMRVRLVGIDYLTIEPQRSRRVPGMSVHMSLLGAGIMILEGLRLRDVAPGEYELMCLPLNIPGCDGCPVRAVLRG